MCIRPDPPDSAVWGRTQGSAFPTKAPVILMLVRDGRVPGVPRPRALAAYAEDDSEQYVHRPGCRVSNTGAQEFGTFLSRESLWGGLPVQECWFWMESCASSLEQGLESRGVPGKEPRRGGLAAGQACGSEQRRGWSP